MIKSIFKKALNKTLIYGAICLFAAGLIAFPKETSQSACQGLTLCGNILIPSLFPFFVVSSMAVQSGMASLAGRAFNRPMRFLFNVPGNCAPAFILGLVGGYPVGARTAISLYEQKLCSKTEAERLLSFCNNSGPAFILGTVGAVFGQPRIGVFLYCSHVMASVIVGMLFRFYRRKDPPTPEKGQYQFEAMPLRKAFTNSVTSAGSSIIGVCCFVIFFSVALKVLYLVGIIPFVARFLGALLSPLGLDVAYVERLISGILEVTTGITGLVNLTTGRSAAITAAAFMLGWAGVSIHCQVLNFISESDLRTWPYIVGKTMHGMISAALTYLGTQILPFDTQVSKTLSTSITGLFNVSRGDLVFYSLVTIIGVWAAMATAGILAKKIHARKKSCKKQKKAI